MRERREQVSVAEGSGGVASVLVIDVGTSSVRVSSISGAGTAIARAHRPSQVTHEGDRVTLDPEELWSSIAELSREVVGHAGQPDGIGIAALLGTVVVDENLTALTPALLWQDQRAREQSTKLGALLGDRAVRMAGRQVAAELTAPKLMWLAQHEPETLARARWVLSLKDYLVARLTGAAVSDETHAAYTLLCDVQARAWSPELASASAVDPALLPPLVTAGALAGTVTAPASQRTGVLAGVPVAAGGPDGTVGALGAGALRPGVTVDIAGTTDVVVHTIADPWQDPTGSCLLNPYVAAGLWTVGGPTGQTGGAVSWLLGVLGTSSADEASHQFDRAMEDIEPGADGLTFHPTMTGERFPSWRAGTTGAIQGIGPHHNAAHLLRAAHEGAAFVVRQGLGALERLGLRVEQVTVVGGAARDPRSLQLRADAWGVTVNSIADEEATSIGAAMLAAVASGVHDSLDTAAGHLVRPGPAVQPDWRRRAMLDEAYARWRQRAEG